LTRHDPLSGLLTAIHSPFNSRGELALEHLPALMDSQRAGGVDGIVVCGTNGEAASMSVDERKRILEAALACRGDFAIVAATGAAALPDALEMSRHAEQAGADALLLLPPFFFKNPTTEGLAAYFEPILRSVNLPALLYNIPQCTAVPITDALLERLSVCPNLAGVKDSAGEWPRTRHLIDCYPKLKIFAGSDLTAGAGFSGGAAGCISGGANAFPELVAAVRDAARSGSPDAVHAAQARLDAETHIMLRYTPIAASKSLLASRGMKGMEVRPPIEPLSPEDAEQMLSDLREAGFVA
jgi:dihydrodipicolinate synthase/N-acetylneuraminate lyase